MHVVKDKNVNGVLPQLIQLFQNTEMAFEEDSRNGAVRALQGPLTIQYTKPWECVLLDPSRDANPFLHFFDALYILSDRNDVEFLSYFSKQISEYAENDGLLFGAYGYRMRKWFGLDQLQVCIDKLKANPKDRQAVIGLWSPAEDMVVPSKDHPCNMMVVPRVQPDGRLSLTVYNRSNDMLWGATGANAVQFSFLQQYIGMHLGRELGDYYQISNNPHVYLEFGPWKKLSSGTPHPDFYEFGFITNMAFGTDAAAWDRDLKKFMATRADLNPKNFETEFFLGVVLPMWKSHMYYKDKCKSLALGIAEHITAPDWKKAVFEWLYRRKS